VEAGARISSRVAGSPGARPNIPATLGARATAPVRGSQRFPHVGGLHGGLEALGDPGGVFGGAAGGGDVLEVDGEAGGGGVGADVIPGVERRGVALLELDGLPVVHGAVVEGVEVEVAGGRELGPDVLAEEVGAGAPEHALGAGVEVGEAPVPVEREGRVADALDDPRDALLGGGVGGGLRGRKRAARVGDVRRGIVGGERGRERGDPILNGRR
jgi:hypothetical protein